MGPSAEYYISAEYHIPVSNVGMTEVKVKVTLSVDRMAVWILPPCSQQRMAAQKCIMGKLGHSDHVGLPVGPVTITACSVAEECLHFPVSSAKSSTSPWKKKRVVCLLPGTYTTFFSLTGLILPAESSSNFLMFLHCTKKTVSEAGMSQSEKAMPALRWLWQHLSM